LGAGAALAECLVLTRLPLSRGDSKGLLPQLRSRRVMRVVHDLDKLVASLKVEGVDLVNEGGCFVSKDLAPLVYLSLLRRSSSQASHMPAP